MPNISSGPRVRKISADGSETILTTVGETNNERQPFALRAGVAAENTLVLLSVDGRWHYAIAVVSLGILSLGILFWQRKRRARA